MKRGRPPTGVTLAAAFALTAVAVVSACGHSGSNAAERSAEPTLLTFSEPGVGPALTDPSGDPLYLFTRDRQRRVSCIASCTQRWEPLVVPDGAGAQAGTGVETRLIGTIASPGGGRQITYNRWPVYTDTANVTTFSAKDNGIAYDGGQWWVLTPQGGRAPRRRDSPSGSSH